MRVSRLIVQFSNTPVQFELEASYRKDILFEIKKRAGLLTDDELAEKRAHVNVSMTTVTKTQQKKRRKPIIKKVERNNVRTIVKPNSSLMPKLIGLK